MCKIEPFAPYHMPLVLPLLESYSYKPYRLYVRDFGCAAINQLFIAKVGETLSSDGIGGFCAFSGEEVNGIAIWSKLAEDSRHLGFSAARLDYLIASGDYDYQCEIKQSLLKEVLGQCAVEGIRHLNARVDAADLSSIHSLERQGFIMVDGLLTYSRDLHQGLPPWSTEADYKIRFVQPSDTLELKAIARSAFSFDRLHSDPSVPKSVADELHAIWLERSCCPKSGHIVLVAVDERGVLGYSVHKLDRSVEPYLGEPVGIWVIAGTAEHARGRGVARSLCYAMLGWQREHGARIVEGGTQIANIASARLHESCGFRITSSSVSLCKWIEQ